MKLQDVFGVSKDAVASYIERENVDQTLASALTGTRQIIIYGSSKQGKTALLHRHLPETKRVTVHCSPSSTTEDIYRAILRQQGVEIETTRTEENNREFSVSISARFKAMLPFFGQGEAGTEGNSSSGSSSSTTREVIEFNLGLAQDVGELLTRLRSQKFYVLENFHYLSDSVQRQLAFDIRTFEEMGIRVVILGVWRERNRLVQYNGDLQDRVAEVPVEPWDEDDFARVVEKGELLLNVKISSAIQNKIFQEAHGSIAIVQELLKKICEKSLVHEKLSNTLSIEDPSLLAEAVQEKVQEYAARHIRSLEAIAAGSRTRRATEETAALFLPYYFVLVMTNRTFSELKDGIERKSLQSLIQTIHASPENVRTSDVTGMLQRLPKLQADSNIVPPLFDFDPGTRRVKVVDSTLYFFLDNSSHSDIMAEIPHPESTRLD
jgi:hypothetical protein